MREIIIRITDEGELIPLAELVRCKDCKYLVGEDYWPVCSIYRYEAELDGYCYIGERRGADE